MSDNWSDKTLQEVFNAGMLKTLYRVHTGLPAVVMSYDYATQKAEVVPLIKRKIENIDDEESLPSIPSVPVGQPNSNGGLTFIHMPVKAGDIGWLHFSEASMQEYLSSTNAQVVNSKSYRRMNLVDAIFEPKIRPFADALSITNNDDTFIKHDGLTVTLKASGKISIKAVTGEELLAITYSLIENVITLLDNVEGITSLVRTFAGVLSGASDPVVSGAATTLAAALSAYTLPLTGILAVNKLSLLQNKTNLGVLKV